MARETMKNDAEISSLSLAYTLQGEIIKYGRGNFFMRTTRVPFLDV